MRGTASVSVHAGALLAALIATLLLAGPASADRSAAILAINDVYRIEGVEGGRLGGLARVRTLRRELEARHGKDAVLVLHGGDLLFPSLLSRMYAGEQMVALLNVLDGVDAEDAIDERLLVVLGNHEFERDDAPEVLRSRIRESRFRFFPFLLASALLRGAAEALRSRLAVPHRPPDRDSSAWWRALPARTWRWLLSLRRAVLVFFDTSFNVVVGRDQLQTAALGDTILNLQSSIRSTADVLRAEIERSTELALKKAGLRIQDPRAVRVSISVLSGDGLSAHYVSRSEGSLLKDFDKDTLAWVSIASGRPLWWKESYLGKGMVLLEKHRLPVDTKKLMLDAFFKERESHDYEAFIILPIPWFRRGAEPPVRKGAIHISFRRSDYLDRLFDGKLDKEVAVEAADGKSGSTRTQARYDEGSSMLEEPEEAEPEATPGSGDVSSPRPTPDPDPNKKRPFVKDPCLRAVLLSSASALTEMLRYYNEEILQLEKRSAGA